MGLWCKAVGALKDHNSIWQANLSRRTAARNPDIEKAVIRSTTHSSGRSFDRRNVDRVCEWIRISPYNLPPVLHALSRRVSRTGDWLVVLKALNLTHNILNSRLPCVRRLRRLPFDLSNFSHSHAPHTRSWPFNAFVRAYYAFLDTKLVFLSAIDEHSVGGLPLMKELTDLQRQQALIDLLMQIQPQSKAAHVPIILDIMDGIIIEIYDIYSRICRGIAVILMNIYSAGKSEARMALDVVKKATKQGEDLASYFELCQELGCFYASEFPIVDKIPEEGILELEQIIKGFDECHDKAIIMVEDGGSNGYDYYDYDYDYSYGYGYDSDDNNKDDGNANKMVEYGTIFDYGNGGKECSYKDELRTVITDKWERFDDEIDPKNPFGNPLIVYEIGCKNQHQELPDLISF
ncbi:putative clathrin assembly protein At1g25240 [Andrographis paniculata]|uniref:putative clathrin assembly protein At1g25240 n=1 Tax=Andrographis paniculata TaxID=175694 RepID=UPI0021E81FFB|nr:putative clathrin assembly protein At1g25240 [Andrographis paniculata]